MVSSSGGFLFLENAVLGRGSAGVECSINVCLKTSGEGRLGRRGGEEHSESRVVWKTFRNCLGFG